MRPISLWLLLASFSSHAEIMIPWDPHSNPDIMSYRQNHKFSELPLSGKISHLNRLWSGDYWALNKGNINKRWNTRKQWGFNFSSPTKEEVSKMTNVELSELSPSEKYDLYLARYDYPLKNQVAKLANPKAQSWEGICHGWAPASINHDEPRPRTLKNPDGIEIPFGSTDIKALLSYYYAHGFQVPTTHQMGSRCDNDVRNCQEDLNAGAFHIVLANRLGVDGESFVIDIQASEEVWNHPIYSFATTVVNDNLPPNNNSSPHTAKIIRLKTELIVANEGENDWQTVLRTSRQKYRRLNYEYDLDIDAYGNIIGGEWRSGARPDFLWIKEKPKQYAGILSKLKDLLYE